MKFCGSCGAPLEDGTRFCPSCGAPQSVGPGGYNSGTGSRSGDEQEKGIGDKIGEFAGSTARKISDTASSMKDAYNDRMADLSQKKVQLSDGEVPVREYEASRVFIPRVPGKLLITNKRILFYSQSFMSRVFMSTPLNTVGSVQMFFGRDMTCYAGTVIGIVVFIILALIARTFGEAARYSRGMGGLIFLIVLFMIADVAIVVLLWMRKTILLSISAVNSGPGITIGRSNGIGLSLASINGVAGKDAEPLMDEIGAVILDLQQQGDIAIEKWKNI